MDEYITKKQLEGVYSLPLTKLDAAGGWSISTSAGVFSSKSLSSDSTLLVSYIVPSSDSSSLSLEKLLSPKISVGRITRALSETIERGVSLEAWNYL